MTLPEKFRLGANSLARSGIFGLPRRTARLAKDFENSAMDAAVRLIHRESWKALRQISRECGQPVPKLMLARLHGYGTTSRIWIWLKTDS